MQISRNQIFLFLLVLFGSLLFIAVFIKANQSSFTHDESFSYLHYCQQSFSQLISFSDWFANNHVLNSIGMKYAERLFGNSELALRLPNLLLFIVYMYYGFRLLKSDSLLHTLAFFILLCTNDLLTNLFGMARGYGLSCGFMLMAVYHLIRYLTNGSKAQLALFHLAAVLASFSNFTLLTVYAALLLVYNVVVFTEHKLVLGKKINIWQQYKWDLVLLLLSAAVLYEPVRRVVKYCNLDAGGKNGFYVDTVSELAYYSLNSPGLALYKVPAFLIVALKIVFTLFPLVGVGIVIYQIKKKSATFFTQHKDLIVSSLLLFFVAPIIVILHLIFGSDYPIGRFAIFLFPLILLQAASLTRFIYITPYRKYVLACVGVLALLSAGKFLYNFNQHTNAEWVYDADTKNMMTALQTDYLQNSKTPKPVKITAGWLFEPTINYYRVKNNLNWLQPADRKSIDTTSHYFYLQQNELPLVANTNYSILKTFPVSGTLLLRNNRSFAVADKGSAQ